LRGSFRSDPSIGRSQYVPYLEARSNVPGTLNGILESRSRVYLKPEEKKKRSQIQEDQSHISNADNEEVKEESLFLDLGLEPLRRILFDMKKIDTNHVNYNFDNNAARQSGLLSYCDYIHDKSDKMRVHRSTQQKIYRNNENFSTFIR
jgi:hypothetical protein